MYQEFTEGHSVSHITNKADIVTCNMEYFRHNIVEHTATCGLSFASELHSEPQLLCRITGMVYSMMKQDA